MALELPEPVNTTSQVVAPAAGAKLSSAIIAPDRTRPLLIADIFDETPTFGASPWPFIVLMLAGFVIGIFGHISKTRALVALGIGLIFLGTFVIPLIVDLSHSPG